MPKKTIKRRATGKSPGGPRSKAMLLPPSVASVRQQCLQWHVALAAFLSAQGNGALLAQLCKAFYLAWYLCEAGYGSAEREWFVAVEAIIVAAARGGRDDLWRIDATDRPAVIRILDLHEQQLLSAPRHAITEAERRLMRFSQGDKTSPW
ncbi:hypothetical protein [Paraburkholderia acidisoli]|uniref:Fis family transcriptional regulator n=1 Tax=Paraburkholderia acidisoli TaxID=2571748 RepID=A0A7Z2GPY3_9BURK|nr:hypothetical protein [Paraburkholderia acidisoli]QGZ65519.1 hypothetical protein FAZ98_27630 [Paraburkholderia acidisoli]